MSDADSLPAVTALRLVSAGIVAGLIGCSPSGEFRRGAVAVHVAVTSGAGPIAAAELDIWVSAGSAPSVTLDSLTLLTDTAGAVLHTIRPPAVDSTVMVRVAVHPPPGSGLGGQTDSAVALMWLQDPPLDTVRFLFVLK